MIFFLLEEETMRISLNNLLVKIIPEKQYQLISFNGKMDLQASIPKIVPTLSKHLNAKIVIVHDQDNHNCIELKKKLIHLSKHSCCPILVRIACRELEAWFLGDMKAIEKAFPKFKSKQYDNKKKFRNVDHIQKPSIILKKLIPELNNFDVIPKRKIAENISFHMNVNDNKSQSFNQFINGVQKI
jgi:hypothetical protein